MEEMAARTVSGVILAAGSSQRFGDSPPKQLALIEDEPLVRRVARRALKTSFAEVIVVVGFQSTRVGAAVGDLPVAVVVNSEFAIGQSTSVLAGLGSVAAESAAAMFIPVDQPDLTSAVMNALITHYLESGETIVVPSFRGKRGAPVLIDRSLFADLAVIEGDAGGRQLFEQLSDQVSEVPLASADPLRDVDRPEDLRRYRK